MDHTGAIGEDHPMQRPPSWRSLLRAWAAIARRPSRAVFAVWGRQADLNWVMVSLALAAVLSLISNILGGLSAPVAHSLPPSARHTGFTLPSPTELPFAVRIALLEVAGIVDQLAVAYGVALTMPAVLGTMSARFGQVLRPLALSVAVQGGVGLVRQLCIMGLTAVVGSSTSTTCVAGLLDLAVSIYGITLLVNSLSAGSGKGRWAVFGIALAASLVVVLVTLYLPIGVANALWLHVLAR